MPLSSRFFQKLFETGLQAKINLQLKQKFETYSFVLWMNRLHQSNPTWDEIKQLCEPGSESTPWEAQKVESCPRGPTVPRFPQGSSNLTSTATHLLAFAHWMRRPHTIRAAVHHKAQPHTLSGRTCRTLSILSTRASSPAYTGSHRWGLLLDSPPIPVCWSHLISLLAWQSFGTSKHLTVKKCCKV